MAQIKIARNIKLDDIESYYKKLYDIIEENSPVDLMLPKELENYYLGLVPALYQTLNVGFQKNYFIQE